LILAPLLGTGAGWLIGPAAGLNALGPALAGALLGLLVAVLVVRRARAKASVIGPELDVAVIHAGVQQVLRCRAVAGAGAPVEHVYIALAVRESTTRRAHSGSRTFDRPMHKELWRQETRLACTADDVYTCDLPLPEPDALPFSTGRDALGRGVIWEITARVVRESNGDSSEHTGCEIDVQPELVP
jgi:hypothetical protein